MKLIIANWKMNKLEAEIKEYFSAFKPKNCNSEIVFCPPFTYLYLISQLAPYKLGAQNCFYEDSGAFTGEISPKMLKDLGVSYVIVGHSERRNLFKESNSVIKRKVLKVLEHDMIPIICFGESARTVTRENRLKEIRAQVRGFKSLIKRSVLAYEPVWAIGSGISPTQDDVLEVTRYILEIEKPLALVYGGSVSENNCKEFAEVTDGLLVGGASLNPLNFQRICEKIEEIRAA